MKDERHHTTIVSTCSRASAVQTLTFCLRLLHRWQANVTLDLFAGRGSSSGDADAAGEAMSISVRCVVMRPNAVLH